MSVDFSDYKGLLQFAVLLLATAAAILLMVYGRGILVPIILALIIWWLINDVTDMVHRRTVAGWQMPRSVAMLLVFILFTGFLISVSSVFYGEYIDFTDQRRDVLVIFVAGFSFCDSYLVENRGKDLLYAERADVAAILVQALCRPG